MTSVIVDDRLLIEELLVGLDERPGTQIYTTTYWYYRACRAAADAAGGYLSGPFEQLAVDQQAAAVQQLLSLREDVALPDPRATVPRMAEVAVRHRRLNLLNLEAVGAALELGAVVWLSGPGAEGVLPAVLDAERVAWRRVDLD